MKPFISTQLQPLYQKQLGFFIAAYCLMNSFCAHRMPSYLNKYTHTPFPYSPFPDSQYTVSIIVFIRLKTLTSTHLLYSLDSKDTDYKVKGGRGVMVVSLMSKVNIYYHANEFGYIGT